MTEYVREPLGRGPVGPELLEREHLRIEDALRHRFDMTPTRARGTNNAQEGWFRYFDATVYDPGQGSGWYGYINGAWEKLLFQSDALAVFAFAAYASLGRTTPGALPAVGAGWETIPFDINNTTSRGFTTDLGANTITIENDGVYAFSLTLGWEHNSSNQGRLTGVRLWNVTDDITTGRVLRVPTGRNAEATTYGITTLIEITEALKGKAFRLEIGGGDTYSSINWNVSEWSIWNVGEWREPLPSDPQQLLGGGQPLQGGGQPLTT